MNLFSKKIAMLTIFAMSATFLMSFNQKDSDYGKANLVANTQFKTGQKTVAAIPGTVKLLYLAYQGIRQVLNGAKTESIRNLNVENQIQSKLQELN